MTKKRLPPEDSEWRAQIVAASASNLDAEQRKLRSGLGTIFTLVSKALEKADEGIAAELAKTEGERFQDDESAGAMLRLEFDRTTFVDALELVYALIDGTDHPIFRYVAATRSQKVKGRPRRTERENLQSALLAAFIDEASDEARSPRISKLEAAKNAAAIFNELARPIRPKTANSVRSLYGHGMGPWGETNYKNWREQLRSVPTEKLAAYTRIAFARLCDAGAVAAVAGLKRSEVPPLSVKRNERS